MHLSSSCLDLGPCNWWHDPWCLLFVLAERSQDSEVVMLSDSNSTQDAFTDPASSQDSNHKPASVKASSSSSESTTPVKDGQLVSEDTGTLGLKCWICSLCVYLFHCIVLVEWRHFIMTVHKPVTFNYSLNHHSFISIKAHKKDYNVRIHNSGELSVGCSTSSIVW